MVRTDHPVVRTGAGAVRGRWKGGAAAPTAVFRGVPYADAPVGDLRFAAPRRRTPWDGVRDAVHDGPTAQLRPLTAVTTIPEPSTPGDDVLNLVVFTPAPGSRTARLPVLVWIHGGGYLAGCQNSPWYDGSTFTEQQVVTVSIGYRLGAEGWLRLAGAPDNRGALDWVAGLEWVRENIAEFGGDPDNVTVAGQSAGGGAVLSLLTMPSARGLFSRAMSISGALSPDESATAADLAAADLAALADVPATVADLSRLGRHELDELVRTLSTDPAGGMTLRFGPYSDGETIPMPVLSAVREGAGADIPLLLGTTRHEFNAATAGLELTEAQVRAALAGLALEPVEIDNLVAVYGDDGARLVGQALTDVTFRRPAVQVAGTRSGGPAPTWLYEFDWVSAAPATRGLAFHCLDLPFWWGRMAGDGVEEATGPNPPASLATAMHTAMTSFVTGNSPGWEPFDAAGRSTRVWADPPSDDSDPFADVIGSGMSDTV